MFQVERLESQFIIYDKPKGLNRTGQPKSEKSSPTPEGTDLSFSKLRYL